MVFVLGCGAFLEAEVEDCGTLLPASMNVGHKMVDCGTSFLPQKSLWWIVEPVSCPIVPFRVAPRGRIGKIYLLSQQKKLTVIRLF